MVSFFLTKQNFKYEYCFNVIKINRSIINDSYKQTDLCLIYPPYIITLACMFVAAMYAGKDVLHWFAGLNIEMRTVTFF